MPDSIRSTLKRRSRRNSFPFSFALLSFIESQSHALVAISPRGLAPMRAKMHFMYLCKRHVNADV
jgi:hypothetical protein